MQSLRASAHEADEIRSKANLHCKAVEEAEGRAASLSSELAATKTQAAEAISAAVQRAETAESMLEEARQNASRASDAVKVKEKMVDSANRTIEELKETVSELKEQLAEEQRQFQVPNAHLHSQQSKARLIARHSVCLRLLASATNASVSLSFSLFPFCYHIFPFKRALALPETLPFRFGPHFDG